MLLKNIEKTPVTNTKPSNTNRDCLPNGANTCTPSTSIARGTSLTSYNTTTGTYYIRYKITNGAGVSSSVGSYTAKVDTTTPTITMASSSSYTYGTSTTIATATYGGMGGSVSCINNLIPTQNNVNYNANNVQHVPLQNNYTQTNQTMVNRTYVTTDNKPKKKKLSSSLGPEFKIALLIIVVLLVFIFLLPVISDLLGGY